MNYQDCPHEKATKMRDENDDRIRTIEQCDTCETQWTGCLAKRLSPVPDDDGNREWWGPVGLWVRRSYPIFYCFVTHEDGTREKVSVLESF